MIEAVIFDMDGVLIDTEPLWRKAEQETFGELGIRITGEMLQDTYGMGSDDIIHHWYNHQPWPDYDIDKTRAVYLKRFTELFNGSELLMEGAIEAVEMVRSSGYLTAIATSSPRMLIERFLDRFRLRDCFHVSHTSEDEVHGKPHPAVYLGVASRLGVIPSRCLAIEDSINGMLAAKSARMKTIVIPEPANYRDKRYVLADKKLHSLRELSPSTISSLSGYQTDD